MQCKNCGVECAENYNFCPACGHPVNNYQPDSEPTEEVVAVNPENVNIESVVNSIPDVEILPETAQDGESVYFQPVEPAKKSKAWLFVLIAVALVLVVCVFVLVKIAGTANLHEELKRDWSRVENSDGTYYTVELDFSETTIDYNFDSAFDFMDATIGTFEYKVTGSDKILVIYDTGVEKEISVEFNDDRTMMILRPAITSTETMEFWYNN